MNRQILFRGKSSLSAKGEWVYGYVTYQARTPHGLEDLAVIVDRFGSESPVISQTVGQWTGLEDRNGVKLFEGDFLVYDNPNIIYHVRYDGGAFVFEGKKEGPMLLGWEESIGESPYDGSDMFLGMKRTSFHACLTIIGNIHDNPELL